MEPFGDQFVEPLSDRLFFVFPEVTLAILFVVTALPLVYRKIPMNGFYGVRIAKAFESDEAWYRINEAGGKMLLRWSVVFLIPAVVKFFIVGWLPDYLIGVFLGGPVIILCILFLASIVRFVRQAS